MPALSKETQNYHQSRIRAVLVVDPQASLREIKDTLAKSPSAPINLDRDYISRLVKKIRAERAVRNDQVSIGRRISELQDKIKRIDGQLWAIAADRGAKDIAKVQALKALAENELKLLSAEMDAGIYDRKVGTLKVEERKVSLLTIINQANPNERANLINAFKNNILGQGSQGNALPPRPAVSDRTGNLPVPPEVSGSPVEAGGAS
jgi:hypothetical protein